MKVSDIYRKILLTIVILSVAFKVTAQETCPLPIMVETENANHALSGENERLLNLKLQQLVASNGFGSSAELSHLCLRASVSENGDKQIISGNRPIVSGSFDVYLVLTNLISGENFGADRISLKGAGNNEERMIQSALARINPTNVELQRFIQNARVKVFDYYRSHIPFIINEAAVLSRRGYYDKALYLLSTVPQCVEGYDSICGAMLKTFDEYLDVDCHKKLAKANSIWATCKTDEGANAAAAYLAAIDHRSTCYPEALELLKKISDRIDENIKRMIAQEDEERELELELIRGEQEMKRKQIENDFQLRQQEIDAIRQLSQSYVQSVVGPLLNRDKMNQDYDSDNDDLKDDKSVKGKPIIIVNN